MSWTMPWAARKTGPASSRKGRRTNRRSWDCCLFASSPEGIPTTFRLGPTEELPDHRYKVFITYTFRDRPGTYLDRTIPLETWHWRDAVIVAHESGQYRIDDFVFLRDSEEDPPRSPPSLLSEGFKNYCRGCHWIGGN
jgi:hypothetical protein